jgi:hypothetical protein
MTDNRSDRAAFCDSERSFKGEAKGDESVDEAKFELEILAVGGVMGLGSGGAEEAAERAADTLSAKRTRF